MRKIIMKWMTSYTFQKHNLTFIILMYLVLVIDIVMT